MSQVVTHNSSEELIDWIHLNVVDPEIFHTIRNWVTQHIRESMVNFPDGDPGIIYTVTPAQLKFENQPDQPGYGFQMTIATSRTSPLVFTAYFEINEEGKIVQFHYQDTIQPLH